MEASEGDYEESGGSGDNQESEEKTSQNINRSKFVVC
jgi:hypothetical protein